MARLDLLYCSLEFIYLNQKYKLFFYLDKSLTKIVNGISVKYYYFLPLGAHHNQQHNINNKPILLLYWYIIILFYDTFDMNFQ